MPFLRSLLSLCPNYLNKRCKSWHSDCKFIKMQQCYWEWYHELYMCLTFSRNGENLIHCTVCINEFSCRDIGQIYCKHIESKQNAELTKLIFSMLTCTLSIYSTHREGILIYHYVTYWVALWDEPLELISTLCLPRKCLRKKSVCYFLGVVVRIIWFVNIFYEWSCASSCQQS
jgi:hypothetical protein